MGSFSLVEKYDMEKLKKICEFQQDETETSKLKKLLKTNLKNNGNLEVEYYFNNRLSAKGICMANLSKRSRAYLLRDTNILDLDMTCCNLYIIKNILIINKAEPYEVKFIETLIETRAEILSNIGTDYYEAKQKLISWINGGAKPDVISETEHYTYKCIMNKIVNLPLYSPITKLNKKENYNIVGKKFSRIIYFEEYNLIMSALDYFKQKKIKIESVIFDGLHIRGEFSQSQITELQEHIKKQTNFETKWVIKPFEEYQFENLDDENKEYSGDNDLALKLYEDYKNFIKLTPNGIYCKQILNKLWSNDYDQIFKTYIQDSNYFFFGKNREKVFIKNQTHKWKSIIIQLETYICANVPCDRNFLEKLDNYKDYIPFLNCCFDLKNQIWIENLPDDIICSKAINKVIDFETDPSPEEINRVNEIFDSILEEYKQPFLSYCIRMLGGNCADKKWMSSIGLRNSGKGVIEKIFHNLFECFVGQIDTKNLEAKNSLESTERSRGFLEPFYNSRLVFSSEARPDAVIDGTILKSITSGGDKFIYRQSYKTLQTGYFRAGFVFQANTLPKIEPADAHENILYFPMPCKFVSLEELNNNYGGYKVKLADPNIKTEICNENLELAFYKVIFGYYLNSNPYQPLIEASKELQENEENGNANEFVSFENLINENFEITKCREDTFRAKELHKIIKSNGLVINTDRIYQYLKTMGVILDKNGKFREYRFIKMNID